MNKHFSLIFKKTIIVLFCSYGFINTTHADEASYEHAVKTQDEIQNFIMKFKGVNGIGISKCSSESGERDIENGDRFCIVINTETKSAEKALKTLLPAHTHYNDVLIIIDYIGKISTQPRLSIGN